MIFSVSERIAEKFIHAKIITAGDKDLYTYGLRQGFLIILNVLITIVIGLIFKMIWQSLIFLFAFIPLRSYSGGYHARTPFRCCLLSVVIMAEALLGIKLIPWNGFICLAATLCAGSTILLLGPVEDRNKPLSRKETAVYKKRTQIILSILAGAALVFWFVGNRQVPICITTVFIVLSMMLVLGKIKNMFGGKIYV